jgi:hypothetical protein
MKSTARSRSIPEREEDRFYQPGEIEISYLEELDKGFGGVWLHLLESGKSNSPSAIADGITGSIASMFRHESRTED